MRQSASEAKTLLVKAGRGVGVPIGLLEDLAPSALWLQACGRNGLDQALAAIQCLDEGRALPEFVEVPSMRPVHSEQTKQLSSFYLLVALGDRLQLGGFDQQRTASFHAVDCPELVAAALVLLHRELKISGCLTVRAEASVFISEPRGGGISVLRSSVAGQELGTRGSLDVSVDRVHDFDREGDTVLDGDAERLALERSWQEGLVVAAETVEGLQHYASRLLVPESDQSLRFGAGAGIIDSD